MEKSEKHTKKVLGGRGTGILILGGVLGGWGSSAYDCGVVLVKSVVAPAPADQCVCPVDLHLLSHTF